MLDGAKKTLSHAAASARVHKSQFSRLLTNHGDLALASLNLLAAEAAKLAELTALAGQRRPVDHCHYH